MTIHPSNVIRSPIGNAMLLASTVLLTVVMLPGADAAIDDTRPEITREADIPRSSYTLPGLPSKLILDTPEGLLPLAKQLKADVTGILDGYDIQDTSSKRTLLLALLRVAVSEENWPRALEIIDQSRALIDDEAERAATNFLQVALATAAIEAGTRDSDNATFRNAYRQALEEQVAAIDVSVSGTALRQIKNSAELVTLTLFRGALEGTLDPNAEAQDFVVNRGLVSSLLANRQSVESMPINYIIAEVIGERLATGEAKLEDLWSKRQVDLSSRKDLTLVTVGIWDTGTDVSQFKGRVWQNKLERMNGKDDDGNGFIDDLNGIAFTPDWNRSTGLLRPISEEDAGDLDRQMLLVKGNIDMRAGRDTDEARFLRATMAKLEADEVQAFQQQMTSMALYSHGTSTADVAQRGNPAVRLLPVRFDQSVGVVPVPFDEAYAEGFAQHVQDAVEYFDAAGTRVVNMSWRFTTPAIESTLASVEPDADRRRDRAIAVFEIMNNALIDAFKSKPHMLFVAGAGNENEDVEFVRSLPAGINLPNVITVGAVNYALNEASFTSYGTSIDVYANGQDVPSRVPGGMTLAVSGTSIAAPQVVNLAAMIWAVQPELGVDDVRQKIIDNATLEGGKELLVISPAASLATLVREVTHGERVTSSGEY